MGTRIPLSTTDTAAKDMADKLEMSTAEIGLSVRTTNCLEERGIFTVRDLLNCTREDLLSISNFGEKTLEEVYKALEGIGFFRRTKRDAVGGPLRTPPQQPR
jgi:DNA-directed RNA polymerase subunit alpha